LNTPTGVPSPRAVKVPLLVMRLTELLALATLCAVAGNDVRDSNNDRENQAEPQHMRGESEAAEYEQQDDREDKQHGNLQLDAQPVLGR